MIVGYERRYAYRVLLDEDGTVAVSQDDKIMELKERWSRNVSEINMI